MKLRHRYKKPVVRRKALMHSEEARISEYLEVVHRDEMSLKLERASPFAQLWASLSPAILTYIPPHESDYAPNQVKTQD